MDTIEFRRTADDVLAFNVFLSERMGQLRRLKIWGVVFSVLFFGGSAWWLYETCEPFASLLQIGAGTIYATIWVLWLAPWRQRQCIRRAVKRLYGKEPTTSHKVTLTDAGIQESTSEGNTFHSWSGVREITRTVNHLLFFVGPGVAHIIPVAAFGSRDYADAFLAAAQVRKARSQQGTGAGST